MTSLGHKPEELKVRFVSLFTVTALFSTVPVANLKVTQDVGNHLEPWYT